MWIFEPVYTHTSNTPCTHTYTSICVYIHIGTYTFVEYTYIGQILNSYSMGRTFLSLTYISLVCKYINIGKLYFGSQDNKLILKFFFRAITIDKHRVKLSLWLFLSVTVGKILGL